MIKTWIVWWKATKNVCKHEKTIWILPTDPWCNIIRTRDTKERKYKWWQFVSGTQALKPATLLSMDSSTVAFLWLLQNV